MLLSVEKNPVTVPRVAAQRTRRSVNLKLTPAAEQIVRGVKDELGMTQQAAMERYLAFLAEVDPRLRTAMLSPHPEVRRACARDLLREMTAEDADQLPPVEAVAAEDVVPEPASAGREQKPEATKG